VSARALGAGKPGGIAGSPGGAAGRPGGPLDNPGGPAGRLGGTAGRPGGTAGVTTGDGIGGGLSTSTGATIGDLGTELGSDGTEAEVVGEAGATSCVVSFRRAGFASVLDAGTWATGVDGRDGTLAAGAFAAAVPFLSSRIDGREGTTVGVLPALAAVRDPRDEAAARPERRLLEVVVVVVAAGAAIFCDAHDAPRGSAPSGSALLLVFVLVSESLMLCFL
jgi:hypothetical protein